MKSWGGAWLVVVALMGPAHASAAQTGTGAVLRSVQIAVEGGLTVVTIDGDGALPLPTPRSLDGPSRIYLDLPGVRPRTRGTTQLPGAGVVSRARIALNSVGPNVTRVVLDLTQRESFRLIADERQAGRIRIFVGPASAPSESGLTASAAAVSGPKAPVRSPVAPPPDRARTEPQPPQVAQEPRLPARDAEQYREQLSGALERIEAQRSVIVAIGADENVAAEALGFAAAEFDDPRRLLGAVKPSSVVKPTHDLLIVSCTLAATAARLRIEAARDNRLEARRNAGTPAAGSLMLLDRACASLGCAGTPR